MVLIYFRKIPTTKNPACRWLTFCCEARSSRTHLYAGSGADHHLLSSEPIGVGVNGAGNGVVGTTDGNPATDGTNTSGDYAEPFEQYGLHTGPHGSFAIGTAVAVPATGVGPTGLQQGRPGKQAVVGDGVDAAPMLQPAALQGAGKGMDNPMRYDSDEERDSPTASPSLYAAHPDLLAQSQPNSLPRPAPQTVTAPAVGVLPQQHLQQSPV